MLQHLVISPSWHRYDDEITSLSTYVFWRRDMNVKISLLTFLLSSSCTDVIDQQQETGQYTS